MYEVSMRPYEKKVLEEGTALLPLREHGVMDTSELVKVVDWCIVMSGAPLGNEAAGTWGVFGASYKGDKRYDVVSIGGRKANREVIHSMLAEFAAKYLDPYGVEWEWLPRESHDWPWLNLTRQSVETWVRAIESGQTRVVPLQPPTLNDVWEDRTAHNTLQNLTRISDHGVEMVTEPSCDGVHPAVTRPDFETPLELSERCVISQSRVVRALGTHRFNRTERQGWHVLMRGEWAALRRPPKVLTHEDVDYVLKTYGIATTLAYGGWELSVNPYDPRNAHLRES